MEFLIRPGFKIPKAVDFKTFARYVRKGIRGMVADVPSRRSVGKAVGHVFSGIVHKAGVEIDCAAKKDVHAVCASCNQEPDHIELCLMQLRMCVRADV